MITYNPKDWWKLIFAFHRSDSFRVLLPGMIARKWGRIVSLGGNAGTGKSVMALAAGLDAVLLPTTAILPPDVARALAERLAREAALRTLPALLDRAGGAKLRAVPRCAFEAG